ncbi:glycoside hydrolase family 3 N-terminal domain-containing protein [uncultured Shewanella sp.]|uniref:glycoside hydrolase family 3 N-terminal domain-containing protein n=1 Tax=uncultured Shewanella sp. TaxID=173975 RepID=UPI002604458A|nr:glycoside hydrolase family 3 N-terminal domain-containing protein [uncultured Shewanella sp.]
MVEGLQQINQNGTFASTGVLATIKHFIGDGATESGVDQGNVVVTDEDRFTNVNAKGYEGGIDANAGSLMVSYSSVNSTPMSIEDNLKSQLLDGTLTGKPFKGFVVSDYGAIANIADRTFPMTLPYEQALALAINNGIDMIMITSSASDYTSLDDFLTIFEKAVTDGLISEKRIDEAVNNILAVKYAMGLISLDNKNQWHHSFKTLSQEQYPQKEKINLAVKAAEKSLVLLKNDNDVLPVKPNNIQYVVFVGDVTINEYTDAGSYQKSVYQNYNNIGAQAGGWTMSWQGAQGNTWWEDKEYRTRSGAMSVLDAAKNAFPDATLLYPDYGNNINTTTENITSAENGFLTKLADYASDMTASNTLIIGVLAEYPYSEFMGDVSNPYCAAGLDSTEGCLFSLNLNAYLMGDQPTTLAMDYDNNVGFNDDFAYQIINQVQGYDTNIPLISILLSGRTRIIDGDDSQALSNSDAFIAAWLPGPAAGTALTNAITGQYLFCDGQSTDKIHCNANSANTLSVDWISNDESLQDYPIYSQGKGRVKFDQPLFEVGYGLATFSH